MGLLLDQWQAVRRSWGTSGLNRGRRRACYRSMRAEVLNGPYGVPRGYYLGHRRDSRKTIAANGRAISAAIASGDLEQLAEALESLAATIGRGRAAAAFRKIAARRGDLCDAISYCECCNGFSAEALHRVSGGERVCDTCLEDDYCTCDDCAETVANDDVVDIGGENVCSSCRENGDYFHCGDCSEWFNSSDGSCELASGRCVCSACSEDYYYWESDGLYHDEEEDDETVTYPNQGPSQTETPIWKWLTARAAEGIKTIELPNSSLDDNAFSRLWQAMLDRRLITWGYNGDTDWQSGDRLANGGKSVRAGAFEAWARNEGWGRSAGGVPWSSKAGTLPKRIAKYFAHCGLKLRPDSLGMIGDLARSYCPKANSYRYDVVKNGGFDWASGDFGDHGSCYWGCHSRCRYQLQTQHNAFALRWYRKDVDRAEGCGRCWVVVQKGIAFLFNYYGPDSLLTAARMLATECNGLYHECRLSCNGGTGDFYLNGSGNGYAVGYCSDAEFPTEHDFSFRGF